MTTHHKHTSGPWRLNGLMDVFAGEKYVACTMGDLKPDNSGFIPESLLTANANARIISLAPEMLDALIDLHGITNAHNKDYQNSSFYKEVQEIINKAEGK